MAQLRKAFLVLASAIVISTAKHTSGLGNIKNVVVLVQENRLATIHISSIKSIRNELCFRFIVHSIGCTEISPIAPTLITSVT
jgi:hypothetical protein